jgi:DNA primase
VSVEALLNEKGIPFTSSGRDYLIKCLNPEHDDSNPSLRVDKVNGVAHCFACGWKRNLFKHFGVITDNSSIRIAKLKEKIKELKVSMQEVVFPDGATPYTQPFRGISSATLKYFEAFYTHSIEKLEDRIIFPLRDVTGKISAFVGRHIMSDANPRYVNYPSGVTLTTYPVKLEGIFTSMVIVEGIFDMLNCYDKGMRNVVSVFGTQSLKAGIHAKLMPYKVQGISKIFILFDGDKAGREAAHELKPLIEEQGFEVEIINLPDDIDPGVLSDEEVASIKEYTSG